MRKATLWLAAIVAIWAGLAHAAAGDPVKVVYHVNQNIEQGTAAIRNIRNHLSVDPKAKIVVVTHAGGIDFLLKDAKDKNGNPFEVSVQDLVSKGVEFRVCNFTLQSRHIDAKQVIEEAQIVPSGVAEVSRLQSQEGYAYLKP